MILADSKTLNLLLILAKCVILFSTNFTSFQTTADKTENFFQSIHYLIDSFHHLNFSSLIEKQYLCQNKTNNIDLNFAITQEKSNRYYSEIFKIQRLHIFYQNLTNIYFLIKLLLLLASSGLLIHKYILPMQQ